jgi:hypothetical protein
MKTNFFQVLKYYNFVEDNINMKQNSFDFSGMRETISEMLTMTDVDHK